MGIGDTFKWAWDGATGAAKSAANAVASGANAAFDGAKYVGGKVVEGAQYAGGKVVEGAQYAGQKVVQGAQYAGQKVVQGAKAVGSAVGTAATETARAGGRILADGVYTAAGHVLQTGADAANAVGNAVDKAKEFFTGKPPEQPCIDCSGKDSDYDGVLVGYKDGKCVPLTSKGKPITDADIQRAKDTAYNPTTNPAIDPKEAVGGDRNTREHTGKDVRQCCQGCKNGENRTIFYVNGIKTPHQTHCNTLKQIGDMTCANVVGIYNATEGAAKDALQTGRDRALIDQAKAGRQSLAHDGRNPAVDTVSDLVTRETRAGRPVEIMAHSQGGAVTSLGLYDARNQLAAGPPPKGSLGNVKVTSFGAAAPTWIPEVSANSQHYVHIDDFTPMNFGVGQYFSERLAGGAKVIKFSGEPDGKFSFPPADKQAPIHFTKYHGIDNELYLRAYQQHAAAKDKCGCGLKELEDLQKKK
ncbi:hypothetical protein [Polyangium aurulentum]|uniref:hypothetical protein n=1 Tax=Polyangium aurulentum TaxID=2567896 RepID=UPI0010AEA474|nr:hypothetical protein [Polyangium aurulentum]UQA55600.1 hypothetical protein E8A73_030195 [Polyangium aurulentum]